MKIIEVSLLIIMHRPINNECLQISTVLYFLFSITGCSSFHSQIASTPENVSNKVTLCRVVEDISAFENISVTMEVRAQAALHEFDVALADEACPNRNIFLSAEKKFQDNKLFMHMLLQLYPDYPNGGAYNDVKVGATVTGKIIRKKNRNLLMTYLELQSIDK